MNFFSRQDRMLLGGLAIAMAVVFARPIQYLFDLARDVERTSGLALVPALIILTVVFFFHQQGKRQEAKARAAAAEAEALEAEARAAEMERLVVFGQALGRSLDIETIRGVVVQHLPKLAGTDEAWVMVSQDGRWHSLVGVTREGRRETDRSRASIADRALTGNETEGWRTDPVTTDGHVCMPMIAGGHAVGVVGVPE